MSYDWPPTEALVALVKKHGQAEAAARLGVPRTTLASHLRSEGVPPEDRQKQAQSVNVDALREVADLAR